MQKNTSARKFSLRTPRFDSNTGRRRGFWYSWRALAAGLALALLAGSGIAVAAAGAPAEAHNHKITVSCAGIKVHGDNYRTKSDDATPNTVTVTISGVTQVIKFGADYDNFFPFANAATAPTDYAAQIKGYDPGYQEDASGTAQPCPTPSIELHPDACTAVNSTISLSAAVSNLDNSHAYTIELTSPDGNGATTSPATSLTVAGGSSSKAWQVVPGHNYTVTVVDTTVQPLVLTASKSVLSIGCPVTPGLKIAGTECTVPGGSGTFTLTASGLSFAREYTIALYDTKNVLITSTPATGDFSGTVVVPLAAPAGGTYYATITDKADTSKTKTSSPLSFLPCPQDIPAPKLVFDPCTVTSPPSNAVLIYQVTGLVPNREYSISVTGPKGAVPPVTFTASTSTWPADGSDATIKNVDPGDYTVTVTDIKVPAYTKSVNTSIIQCPTLPALAFTPTECSVPGGTASILTTVTTFIPGRDYTVGVTLVQGGGSVVAPTTVKAPLTGAWTIPFSNLPPGVSYRVTISDAVVPSVIASGDISLKACPGMPSITVDAVCNPLGISTLTVSLDKLEPAETYTVNVVNAANSKNVGTATVAGTTPATKVQLKNIPNGNNYMVSVANATNTLTGSATFFLKKCDLPTLAFTGANPVGPAVAGLGFLQLGLVMVGLNLVFRRRRTA